jgi:plastocyanin
LLLLCVLLGAVVLALPLPGRPASPAEHIFHVQASRFEFSPAVLRVNPGDQVTIELTSTDVVHGLVVDGYNLSTTADPGQTSRLQFTASRSGVFRLRCSATCGNLHPFMIGKLYVGGSTLFWKVSLLSVLTVSVAFIYGYLARSKVVVRGA